MVTIKAKWGKIEFDIIVDSGSGADRSEQVMSQISEKTNIPQDKIKVIPATVLNPSFQPKDMMRVTVIGTAQDKHLSSVPSEAQQTRFIEDMTEEQIAIALRQKRSTPPPVGLDNLGNTCYMNAVFQCLRRLDKFRERLISAAPSNSVGVELVKLLLNLESSHSDSITPSSLVASVRLRFPQFNQRDSHGQFAQQDADEFFRALLHELSSVDSLFAFHTESSWKCLESESEPVSTVSENLLSLTCHMGTQLEPVNHLHEGIQLSLKEVISKEASSLGRSARFEKRTGLASLPQYLMVQLARFQWKAKSDSAGTEATKTKIIRKITFQKTLDVYDLCTDSVKTQLDAGRERRRELIDAGAQLEEVQTVQDADGRLLTGVYQLVAIVSHQGRTSDGGHYIGWARKNGDISGDENDDSPPPQKKKNGAEKNEAWFKFDDDVVSETNWTAMTETGGMLGGLADSQMAYLLFYARTSVSNRDC